MVLTCTASALRAISLSTNEKLLFLNLSQCGEVCANPRFQELNLHAVVVVLVRGRRPYLMSFKKV